VRWKKREEAKEEKPKKRYSEKKKPSKRSGASLDRQRWLIVKKMGVRKWNEERSQRLAAQKPSTDEGVRRMEGKGAVVSEKTKYAPIIRPGDR